MTILTFPSNPINGQVYNAPNGVRYVYDGIKWIVEQLTSTSEAVTNSVQDRVAPMFVDGDNQGITFSYDAVTNTISAEVTSTVGNALVNGENQFSLESNGTVTLNGDPFTSFSGSYSDLTNKPTIPNLSSVAENILPDADNTRDLGSPTNQWRHVYTAGGSIYLDNIKLTNVNGKFVATKVINPGEENEAEDPEDSDATSEIGGGGGGSGVVEREIVFPGGEEGDIAGTIALTPNGETYICTADWTDTQYTGSDGLVTIETYNIGQSGGALLAWTVDPAAHPDILAIFTADGWNGTSPGFNYSQPGRFTVNSDDLLFPGSRTCIQAGINNNGDMFFHVSYVEGDATSISSGDNSTIVQWNFTVDPISIWRRLASITSTDGADGSLEWTSEGDLTIETIRPEGYTEDCDVNIYAADDVWIQAKGDEVNIKANSYVTIETDDGNHAWTFAQDGSLKLPGLSNTGYEPFYDLSGPTLRLGGENDPSEQIIITGPVPDQNNINAQRLVIQGQKGWGGESTAGEGGDIYIWGGVGGEYNGGTAASGNGGDIKVRGGAGQFGGDGGYVKIEGGNSFYGPDGSGGFIEISAGDRVDGGNGDGGDVNIRAGRGNGSGNNGVINLQTGNGPYYDWVFDNGGNLSVPGNITSGDNIGLAAGDAVNISSNNTGSAKTWNFDEDGVLHLPSGGDIVDSNGNTVLGAALDTNIWVQEFASDVPLDDKVLTATSVEYDADGNVIALFYHENVTDNSTYMSAAKFDTSGAKLWQARISSGFYSNGWGLAVDSQAVYIAGTLEGEGSPAEYKVSTLIKLNTANGNVIWMKSYDFGDESSNNVVDVASDGHPVIVGHAYSGGQAFITTTKIDKDTGSIIWSRKLDGQNGEYAYGMAVGPAGEVVVIGYVDNAGTLNSAATLYSDPASNVNWVTNTGVFSGGVNFGVTFTDGVPSFNNISDPIGNRNVDDTIGTASGVSFGGTTPADDMIIKVGTVTAGDPYDKMVVIKYDSTGSIQWQKAIEFDAGFDCSGADADIDSNGNVYVCGNYRQDNGLGSTRSCMSLVKFDGNGAKQWSRRVVGDCDDFTTSVVVGPDNCLYLSGITGTNATSDYTFVIAKYSTTGTVLWQRLLDNTTTWTFGGSWFGAGGGSNIAVKNGYVAVSGTFGDPGTPFNTAFIAQINSSGVLFTTGDWDFKGASFSGLLNSTASDITVTNAGKSDSDNSGDITTGTPAPNADYTNFLVPTKYVLSIALGDLTVINNTLRGTGSDQGDSGLYLAPGPNLAANMYFRVRGGDTPTHLHFDTGDNTTYDQYWGDDNKYLKLGADGNVYISTWDPMVGGETWTFSTDRTTTIPGALIQGTIAQTYIDTPIALDIKRGVNKLANGDYTLANGVEGQVMYLVGQDGITPGSVGVTIANARIDGISVTNALLIPFRIFNDANASYHDSRGFCTLIFVDGAWQQNGGSWD